MADDRTGWASRRTLLGGSAGVAALAIGGAAIRLGGRSDPPAFGTTVALRSDGATSWRTSRSLLEPADLGRLVHRSRVLEGVDQHRLLEEQDAWLEGVTLPSSLPPDLARSAALDLWSLGHGLPVTVAGWSPMWRKAWPRDTAHVAVALARLGDGAGAARQLAALARFIGDDSTVAARFELSGRIPDDRPAQDDGLGWVLWSAELTREAWLDTPAADSISRLVHHCAATALTRLTKTGLPRPSPDYWEVPAPHLTLGTAAPILAGLEAATRLLPSLPKGDPRLADRCRVAAARLEGAIHDTFGERGWPREIEGGPSDTAIAFMLPPYRPDAAGHGELHRALRRAAAQMRRDNGGYAPGGGWREDGVAWTPETAVLAGAWALEPSTHDRARGTLDWLAGHRTAAGSLPEKVRDDGSAAGPAPLAWTAAVVLTAGRDLDEADPRP